MRVVIAPDSFGGTLDPVEAAEAIAAGWRHSRPDDELVLAPMSDGGEGLLVALAAGLEAAGRPVQWRTTEVVDPRGLAVDASWLLLDDGATAIIEAARASGLALVAPERRDPRMTTTWGVGQLIAAAAAAGARRVLVGLGGTATVDGGAGALSGLGFRVTVQDGSGLKIGGEDLPRVAGIAPDWVDEAVLGLDEVIVLSDVRAVLVDAAPVFGPQKGADEATVAHLAAGLESWADVVEGVFQVPGLRDRPGTGAAGGLGFALAGALGATLCDGADAVAGLVGLAELVAGADLVVTGEGRLDATSFDGKVVGEVVRLAGDAPVVALVGSSLLDEAPGSVEVVEMGPATSREEAIARLHAAVAGIAEAQ